MTKRYSHILPVLAVLCCFLLFMPYHFSMLKGLTRIEKQAIQDSAMHYLQIGDISRAEMFGNALFKVAYEDQDYHDFVIYAHLILGQICQLRGDSLSAYNHLGQAEQNTHSAGEDKVEKEERHTKMLIICAVLAVAFIISLAGFFVHSVRSRKLEKVMMAREEEMIAREREVLKKEAESIDNPASSSANKYSSSSLSDEKKKALLESLETLLKEQKVYKKQLITCDDIAQQLGTNRTYLSQIINSTTGQTFTQYINSYRANEALSMLNDPHCHLSLKAISQQVGFCSQTTFYSQIQKLTGMTPSEYRASKTARMEQEVREA